ncbi:ACT domain-containing protein [Mycolicibacterium smegmatis]|nr:ACT domain-containing protein [Mycolicibacterium smegmatis]CKH75535.1 acetyltransferase [Mycolicibacterium smegmatis]
MARVQRHLVLLSGVFRIDHVADETVVDGDDWVAQVRAPEGLTVIRKADSDERWVGLYGDDAHDLDVTGMLAAVVGPLADADISVFVASTFHSDLVLVPEAQKATAVSVLEAAGHTVREADQVRLL